MYLKKNTITVSENKVIPYQISTVDHTFWEISQYLPTQVKMLQTYSPDNNRILCYIEISNDSQQMIYERDAYTVIDLLGDYGGLLEGLQLLLIFLLGSMPEH